MLATDGHDDAVYELSGDVAWSFDELAAVFADGARPGGRPTSA